MSSTEKGNPTNCAEITGPAELTPHRIPLLQLIFGLVLLIGGATAVLYMSGIWTAVEVRYVEALVVASFGALLVATAVRPQAFRAFR